MKVITREAAEDDLDRIFAWIAKNNRRAAAEIVVRIRDRQNNNVITFDLLLGLVFFSLTGYICVT